MADVTLSDGRAIVFDLHKLSLADYRLILRAKLSEAELQAEDEVVARTAGLTVEEYRALPYPDWRLLVKGLFERAREPLADPN